MVVSITSPVMMNRRTPSAIGTPAAGGDVSVSIVVGSTGELILLVDVAKFFESGENEKKWHHRPQLLTWSMSSGKGSLYPAQLWAEMLMDSVVLYMMSKL